MDVLLEGSPISTEELWSSVRVTIRGHLPDQGPSPTIAQLARAASSRKDLGGSKLLPFKNERVQCVLRDLQCCILWYPSPHPWLDIILSRSSMNNSFDLMAGVLLWHALSTVGPYIDRCVPFHNVSNQLNLPQGDSNQVVETSQGWSMVTRCTWAQIQVSLQRDWIFK